MPNLIYVGQGPIYVGDYNQTTFKVENEVKIGCGNRVLSMSLAREVAEIKESCSGSRLTLLEYEKSKSVTIKLEMQEFAPRELAMGLYGTADAVSGSSITDEAMPTMENGEYYHTKYPKISSVSITDSAGSPATLVLNTDYSIDDANYGRIKILDITGLTQPFLVDYTYGAITNIQPFSITSVIKSVRFDGVSTADGSKVRVLLPRVSFSPTSLFDFLGDEVATLSLEGKLLLAETPANDPILGTFGNIDLL